MLVMISGCSGGGKSTLLSEIARRGYSVVKEPGRRIIAEAHDGDGSALPWADAAAFARRAIEMAIADRQTARGLTFFDRGVVDAAVAVVAAGGDRPFSVLAGNRYDRLFLVPPWPAIYVNDDDRRHSLEKALLDYEQVRQAYLDEGYAPIMLPRSTVAARADFVLAHL